MAELTLTEDGPHEQTVAVDELIPGTHVMKDVGGLHFAKAHHGRGSILLPRPTSDPADPLNWSKPWKGAAVISVALYACFSAASAISMSPLFPLFAEQWSLKPSQVTMITGATVLVLGYGNFLVIPFSNIFGRRAALLLFGVIFLASTLWQGLAQSYGSFLGARVLVGLGASPSETIAVQVVADLFFLHERGIWIGFSMVAAFFGTFIGPVIAGAMGERYGWRSFFWLSLGLFGFITLLVLACFPETKYHRAAEVVAEQSASQGVAAELEDKVTQPAQVEAPEVSSELVGRGRPTWRLYLPSQKPDKRWKAFLLRDFFAPFRIGIYPIIFWASMCLMGAADMTLMFNLTESFILEVAPYNMTPDQAGYTNFAFAIGTLIGMLTAGTLSDWVIKRATLRNGGIREAEMRLPALIPFAAVMTIGVSLGAAAIRYEWPWPVLVIMGYGSAGIGITSLPTIGIAYAVDSYKPISGELMVVATVLKNTIGFSFTYWVPEMGAKQGYAVPLMVWFTFNALPFVLAIPLYFWGKALRRLTKNSPVHDYEEYH